MGRENMYVGVLNLISGCHTVMDGRAGEEALKPR